MCAATEHRSSERHEKSASPFMAGPIEQAVQSRLAAGGKALVPFLTAGFPSATCFVDALRKTPESGCDVVEVGIPFSDPLADGPVIQQASQRSLNAGVTIRRALDLVHRADINIPVVLMSYLNPLLAYGLRSLARDAVPVGVRGVIIPDLPWNSSRQRGPACATMAPHPSDAATLLQSAGIDVILLAAPTTPINRLRMIGENTRGFLYAITMAGVTGARNHTPIQTTVFLRRAATATRRPVLAGFGIDSASSAARIAVHCDGVIIGSALLRALGDGPRVSAVTRFARILAQVRMALSKEESE